MAQLINLPTSIVEVVEFPLGLRLRALVWGVLVMAHLSIVTGAVIEEAAAAGRVAAVHAYNQRSLLFEPHDEHPRHQL